MSELRILIADDEKAARFGMARALRKGGYQIAEAENGVDALEQFQAATPDLMFLDLNMPQKDGFAVLAELDAAAKQSCEIIVVTANDDVTQAVECIRLGANNYITKPYEIEQIRAIAVSADERFQLRKRAEELQGCLDRESALGSLIGVSRPMRELFTRVTRAASADVSVLIRGETGTGKELIAREMHRLSPRADGPFVAVNTAAIADSLAESELFGHKKGAFTGADADRAGVFQQADGGTLFLDEIGDMPPAAQTRILRVLQERIVQPVGSEQPVKVDVRILAATHQNLEDAITDGHFRQDLYFRIKGIDIVAPPLRARREDIVLLANYFLNRVRTADVPAVFSDASIAALLAHNWPGNVRELEQSVQAAAVMADGPTIQPTDLNLPHASPTEANGNADIFQSLVDLPLTEAKSQLTEQFERFAIARALEANDGNVSAAARQLGIHRQNLQQKMTALAIQNPSRKKR